MGSLAGAAHLLKFNADVLRLTPKEQKSFFDRKGICQLDLRLKRGRKVRENGLAILWFSDRFRPEVTEKLPQG
jgi:hypothetical protein